MRSEGQVADLGNARVVICGRCISRSRSVDPGRKASGSRVVIDEELSATLSSSSLVTEGSSSHLTAFKSFSLTESKHTGQRTHLFSAVPRRWRIHGKQNTYVNRETGSEFECVRLHTCPHFVILGAVGGARQIGHAVNPSSCDTDSPLKLAAAIAEVRGMMIWRMSCHWKKLGRSVINSNPIGRR